MEYTTVPDSIAENSHTLLASSTASLENTDQQYVESSQPSMEYTTETVVPDSIAENSHTLLASASDAPDSVMTSSDYVASSESVDIASE
eukprot:scaffold3012_cov172-Alexandrium_tamarense.AAC.1